MSKTIYTKDSARFYVYAFLREDGTPYYIGKGQGSRAWGKRRTISPPTDTSRISILFEALTESEAFSEEIRLIAFYGRKDLGTGILRNLTDGGEGPSGCKRSQKTRAKMSGENHHMYGKKHTPETRAKMSGENHHMYGKKHTPETRAKLSAAKQNMSPETRANMSAAHTGKKQSAETIAKISAAKQNMSPETRAKLSASKLGPKNPSFNKKQSEETKKRRSVSLKENKDKNNNRGGKWYNDGSKNTFIKVKDLEHIGDINPLLIPGRIISLKQKLQMVETRKNNRLSRISDNKV